MKARIKETGEIVDVIKYTALANKIERDTFDSVEYIDEKGVVHLCERGLNIHLDFEELEEVQSTDVDWEQRRYEIAKDILAATYDYPMDGKSYAKVAVGVADALIAELKKGGEK